MIRSASAPEQARRWRRRVGAALGAFVFFLAAGPSPAFAGTTLADWRAELARVRALADNDAVEADTRAQAARAATPAGATAADRARLLNVEARIAIYRARTDEAAKLADQAWALASAAGDRVGEIESDLNVALNSINQGRIDLLVKVTTRCLGELEGVDRPDLVGEALLRASMMSLRLGQMEESVSLAVHAMEIARVNRDPLALAFAYQGLAISFGQSYRYAEARDDYQHMIEQARAAGSRQLEAAGLIGLGSTLAGTGDPEGGAKFIRQAVTIFDQAGAPFATSFGLFQSASVLRLEKRYQDALPLLDQVVAIYDKYPNRIGLWFALIARSANHQALGQLPEARADGLAAYGIARDIGLPLYRSESAKRLSELAATAGNFRRAYELQNEAADMTTQATREKTSARVLELAQRYESESNQRRIDELTQRNRLQTLELDKQRLRQRWLATVLGGSVVALAVASGLLLRLRRLRDGLQEQKSILQSILDGMADGVAVANAQGRLVLINPAARALGIVPASDAVLGSRDWSAAFGLYLPDQTTLYPPARLPLSRAIAGEKSDGVEIFVRNAARPDGAWLSAAGRPLPDRPGEGGVVVLSDITERKLAEAALRRREQEFRALVENTPDWISRFGADGRRTYTNPALVQAMALAPDSLLGKRPSELPGLPPEQGQRYERVVMGVLAGQGDTAIDMTLRTCNGQQLAYQVRVVAERDEAGAVGSVLTIARDVTAMVNVQQRLSALLENLPDMIALLDPQGRTLYVNPAFTREFGVAPENVFEHTICEVGLQPHDRLAEALRGAAHEAHADILEVALPGTRSDRFFEARYVPVMDDCGGVASVLAIFREVTERRRTELLVRELGFRREAAREDERRFIARELHDELGQSLSALRLEASVLRIQHGHISSVGDQATRMLGLVDSVIKIQRDLVSSLRPAVLDMGIGPALEWLVTETAGRAGLRFDLRVSESQLALDTNQTTMVFRIAQESLTNVIRHAHASAVAIALERQGDEYALTVHDNGHGFDPASRRDPKSFGLLSLGERAQMLGGRLEIRSDHVHGTLVRVAFPTEPALALAAG